MTTRNQENTKKKKTCFDYSSNFAHISQLMARLKNEKRLMNANTIRFPAVSDLRPFTIIQQSLMVNLPKTV